MGNQSSKLMRCHGCNGAKMVSPLGGIEKRCKPCNGTGFVESDCVVIKAKPSVKIDKRSKAYRDSLKDN